MKSQDQGFEHGMPEMKWLKRKNNYPHPPIKTPQTFTSRETSYEILRPPGIIQALSCIFPTAIFIH